jgi:hypothetical protein
MDAAYKDLSTKDKTLFGVALPWPIRRHAIVTKLTDFSLAIEKSSAAYKPIRVYSDYTRVRLGKYVLSLVKPWVPGELIKNTLRRNTPQPVFNNENGIGNPVREFVGDKNLFKETVTKLKDIANNPPVNDDDQPGYFTEEARQIRKLLVQIHHTKGTTDCEEYKKARKAYEYVLQKSCGIEEPIDNIALSAEIEHLTERTNTLKTETE